MTNTIDRRRLLQVLGGSAGAALLWPLHSALAQAPRNLLGSPSFDSDPFQLGVASGEPAPDGFVLWTRLAPHPLEQGGGMVMRPMMVRWELAEDESFSRVVRSGEALARPGEGAPGVRGLAQVQHRLHAQARGTRAMAQAGEPRVDRLAGVIVASNANS